MTFIAPTVPTSAETLQRSTWQNTAQGTFAAIALMVALFGIAACGEPQCPAGSVRSGDKDCIAVDGSVPAGACRSCPSEAPVCDISQNICVECLESGDCDGALPVCDVESKRCTGCVADADCGPDSPICDVPSGRCQSCTGDGGCARFAETPHCETGSGECVACLSSNDCDAAAPACNPERFACVECLVDADCGSDAPVCNLSTLTCEGCTDSSDCAPFSGVPHCEINSGSCVACLRPSESADCAGNTCRLSDHTCTSTPIGSKGFCDACEADTDCGDDRACVAATFDGQEVGHYCFPKPDPTEGCSASWDTGSFSGLWPTPRRVTTASIDGDTGEYCLHSDVTTCLALQTHDSSCSTDGCGVPEVNGSDCADVTDVGGTSSLCLPLCEADEDCWCGCGSDGLCSYCRGMFRSFL